MTTDDPTPHCATCTCFGLDPKVVGYCDAEVIRMHETFGCLEPKGHAGNHEGSGYFSACSNCGGLDLHSKECPTPEIMEDQTQLFVPVVWTRDGSLVTWPERDV